MVVLVAASGRPGGGWADRLGAFPADTDSFLPSGAPFMVNYRIDDLDGVLGALAAAGVDRIGEIESYS